MKIPSEPVGSIPRTETLLDAIQLFNKGAITRENLEEQYIKAIIETMRMFEATGSSVVTDGEQSKPSFATYPIHGASNVASGGVTIPFQDGHTRQLPLLTSGPFRYQTYADSYLETALQYAHVPVKQAVISASALSLLYPQTGIASYTREEFLQDLINENEKDIRQCLEKGAHKVQVDFTEARLALKLDPSKNLLKSFIDLNQQVLDRFSPEERKRLGIHTCPGGDQDSTHSADVDYSLLLPELLQMDFGSFYIQMASEKDPRMALKVIQQSLRPGQKIFVGVIDPIHPDVETPEEVRNRVLEAARYIPVEQLGTTDDCGFAPFSDDTSTTRQTSFDKIRSRIAGTELAAGELGI